MFDDDLGLEPEAGVVTQVFVSRPRVTVRTAMLAPSIRIQTEPEAHVRAIVFAYDGFRAICDELRIWIRAGGEVIVVRIDNFEVDSLNRIEAGQRPYARPAPRSLCTDVPHSEIIAANGENGQCDIHFIQYMF